MHAATRTVLVVVHPGSAATQDGAAFDDILTEMRLHAGPICVIDGGFTDALPDARVHAILCTHPDSLRVWGDDAGKSPSAE